MLFEQPVSGQQGEYLGTLLARNVADKSLLDRYNRYFAAVAVNTPELLRRAQELRYQVYCIENQFEDPLCHPDRREKDAFDSHSVHSLLIHRSTGHPVGTVRLVLPLADAPTESFAIQQLIGDALLQEARIPIQTTAEVSRFSISKQVRHTNVHIHERGAISLAPAERAAPLMSLGLIQALVRMSEKHGITHWCALMEPKLLRMLASMAIRFKPLGALVDHHGLRQPCFCHVQSVLDCVKRERPMFWQILTDGGALGRYSLAA
jgi:N-acyl amino acid synthase of PEP-CTERM/exosortase system